MSNQPNFILASSHVLETLPNTVAVPSGFVNVPSVIGTIFNFVIVIAGTIFIILILVGGIQYLTSAGNEEGTGKAKRLMVDAIVGLILTLAAWAIGIFILQQVGLERRGFFVGPVPPTVNEPTPNPPNPGLPTPGPSSPTGPITLNALITVSGTNQPVDQATVYLDEQSVGSTNASGSVSFSTSQSGQRRIDVAPRLVGNCCKSIVNQTISIPQNGGQITCQLKPIGAPASEQGSCSI